ncbi:dihydrodipicolinate synthase family protein [Ensifer sp. ENS05]|uniref:dihydrodipicolinate synthase family protein n=1 Tax=Ensifer sp. ENS05 TaxID=2769277 RepID=UPI001786B7E5|nr:dihydrodipicolinate synthase family protein [Ensifer sp. ENS05]MBD9596902.1 dihydrodipicolinate synthase family protein [Ensifer sp. ENS05]
MVTKLQNGASAAMLTVFREDGTVDVATMAAYGKWLLAGGLNGLLLFGTTGEGPSLSVRERKETLRGLLDSGIPADRIVLGAIATAIEEVGELVTFAGETGCAGALVLPPHYFRTASEPGLEAFFDELFERTAASGARVFLYHFPEMSGLSCSHELISRLSRRHSQRFVGVKDSSGDLANTLALIRQFPELEIYTGDDNNIRAVIAAGGAGSMTATAGLTPSLVANVMLDTVRRPAAPSSREDLLNSLWVDLLLASKVTEAMKALLAHFSGWPSWRVARVPLLPLDQALVVDLTTAFAKLDDGTLEAELRSAPRGPEGPRAAT